MNTLFGLAIGACAAFASTGSAAFIIDGSGTVNGVGSGFGAVIGDGATLDVTTAGDGTVDLAINRGPGEFFNNIAIYIDSVAGGIANTSAFTDVSDGNRRIISGGTGAGQEANLGFAPGFEADFAIAVEGGFAGLFDVANSPSNYTFVTSAGVTLPSASNIPTVELSFNLSDIGLTAGDSFKLLVTYSNAFDGPNFDNNFRSNEFIGASAATAAAAGAISGGNIGINPFDLAEGDFVLVNSVPTPGAVGLIGLAGVAAGRRRR